MASTAEGMANLSSEDWTCRSLCFALLTLKRCRSRAQGEWPDPLFVIAGTNELNRKSQDIATPIVATAAGKT